MIEFFYRLLWYIATPCVPLYLWRRKTVGKEEASYIRDRYGYGRDFDNYTFYNSKGAKLIWLHAASVGEVNSILPLINTLHEINKGHRFLLTTSSRNGQEVARKSAASFIILRYLPLDHPIFVRRFLQYYKPQVALWTEQELWPNILLQAKKLGIKLLLVNGRLTEKSAARWQKIKGFSKRLGTSFDVVLAGSPMDRDNFLSIGWQCDYMGNLKAFRVLDKRQEKGGENFGKGLGEGWGEGEGWLAASLHIGEEALCFAAHKILKQKNNGGGLGGLVVVPRYPNESQYMCEQAKKFGLSAVLYSQLNSKEKYDCIIVDSFGMLVDLYSHFGVCFLGGSCGAEILGSNKGGHNPLEAVANDCVVICGPDMRNFSYICDGLSEANVLLSVSPDAEDLSMALGQFLWNDDKRQQAIASGGLKLKTLSQEGADVVKFISQQLGETL